MEAIRRSGIHSRKTQLFIRSITNGVLSERDLLLSYTIAEFYNEMSLFIEETEKKVEAQKEAAAKAKRSVRRR